MEVNVKYLGKMKFSAECAKHKVMVDLPVGLGGSDEAATPPQLFLSSIASCVGVYIASYCQNKGIDAQDMQINIKADKVPNPNRIDNIKIEVALPKANLKEDTDAILSVAKKCLIHNTIKSNPSIDISLV